MRFLVGLFFRWFSSILNGVGWFGVLFCWSMCRFWLMVGFCGFVLMICLRILFGSVGGWIWMGIGVVGVLIILGSVDVG